VFLEAGAEASPEDLLLQQDGHRFELISGTLVERHMGAKASEVETNLLGLFRDHVRPQQLGKLFGSACGYRCFPWNRGHVRYPDVSFVAKGRLPQDKAPEGHMTLAPDFAAEVVSPNDLADEIEGRRLDFMRAGTRLFWVVYPEFRTVHVFRKDGTALALGEDGELGGEDVLPGFACKVAALFEGL
jgi:Uma2 family endonuclease